MYYSSKELYKVEYYLTDNHGSFFLDANDKAFIFPLDQHELVRVLWKKAVKENDANERGHLFFCCFFLHRDQRLLATAAFTQHNNTILHESHVTMGPTENWVI